VSLLRVSGHFDLPGGGHERLPGDGHLVTQRDGGGVAADERTVDPSRSREEALGETEGLTDAAQPTVGSVLARRRSDLDAPTTDSGVQSRVATAAVSVGRHAP
jgi:hypothetical protein